MIKTTTFLYVHAVMKNIQLTHSNVFITNKIADILELV